MEIIIPLETLDECRICFCQGKCSLSLVSFFDSDCDGFYIATALDGPLNSSILSYNVPD
jgi:hypothetical protein